MDFEPQENGLLHGNVHNRCEQAWKKLRFDREKIGSDELEERSDVGCGKTAFGCDKI